MAFTPKFWRFLILNAIRILSLVALILAFAATIFTTVQDGKAVHLYTIDGENLSPAGNNTTASELDYLPQSTIPQQPAGAFWAFVNHGLVMFQLIVLLIAEIRWGWSTKMFNTYFPVLGDGFGLGPLGIAQALLGATILSHHVNTVALVGSWFLAMIGFINMLLGLVFRESIHDKRSWSLRERAKDVVPSVKIAGIRVDPIDAAERAIHVFQEKPWASRPVTTEPELAHNGNPKLAMPTLGDAKEWMQRTDGARPFLKRPVQTPPMAYNGHS